MEVTVIEWVKLKKDDGSFMYVQPAKITTLFEEQVPTGYGRETKTVVILTLDNETSYVLAGSLDANIKLITGE